MGNSNLKEISIENLNFQIKNSFFFELNEEELYKESVRMEKRKMKLMCKYNKEENDSELIEKCITNHFLLKYIEKPAISEIIHQLSNYHIDPNTEIFIQGNNPCYFFILSHGTCEIIKDGITIKTINPGECFGELSLIYGFNREYTVRTKNGCDVWATEKKNFLKIPEHIANITFETNNKAIANIPLFKVLSQSHRNILMNKLYCCSYPGDKPIFKENDVSYCIYLIKEGELEIKYKGKTIDYLGPGDYFGLISVMNKSNRIFEVIPKDKKECQLFSLPISFLYKLYGPNYMSEILLTIIKSAFIKTKSFSKMNIRFLSEIFENFKFSFYENETKILNKDELKNKYVLIPITGKLLNSKDNTIICKRSELLFGDEIYNNISDKINFDIKCSNYSLIAKCNTKDLLNYLKCSFSEYIKHYSLIKQLKNVPIFRNFTEVKFEDILKKLKIEKIPKGKNLITEGEEGTKFFIIKKGQLDIYIGDKYIRTMNENEYLGERALFFKEPRSATAKAKIDVEVFYLEKEDLDSIIDVDMKEFLSNRLYLQDETIKLKDLIFKRNLGKGSYGIVSLVRSKNNDFLYAIKNISIKQIYYSKLYKNIDMERTILLRIDHPFIVKMVKTLKDQKYIYYLMEFIKGRELYDVLNELNLLSKFQAQFYIGSIMLAVKYLHERKFIFRDIKPENIMALTNGYIKLIDFGMAKIIKDKTNSIVGTPQYMAPEIILGDYYSFEIDYWSIGICLYEFVCGNVPFGENANTPLDIYVSIINR